MFVVPALEEVAEPAEAVCVAAGGLLGDVATVDCTPFETELEVLVAKDVEAVVARETIVDEVDPSPVTCTELLLVVVAGAGLSLVDKVVVVENTDLVVVDAVEVSEMTGILV
jgi:hypothetical protein